MAELVNDFLDADLTDVLAWLSQQPPGHEDDVWQVQVLIGPEGRRAAINLTAYDPYDEIPGC